MTPGGAAAGICAVLAVVTASAELADASGQETSGAIEAAAGDLPVADQVPVPDAAEPDVEVTPTPTPTPEPTPTPKPTPTPEPAAPPAGTAPPGDEVDVPVPPAAAPADGSSGAPDPGAARRREGTTAEGEAPAAPPGRAEAAPDRRRNGMARARTRPNTEARKDGVERSSPDARERPRRDRRGRRGTPAGTGPLVSIPAHWLSGAVAADPIAIPDAVIDEFGIPPFLLPIYQAAGLRYGVPWEILAAINEIETAYGRNLAVSSAGALGWMQFMPSTWEAYGVDANDDGRRDPFDPADAIFAAARYLDAAGAGTDLPKAIYAYNHADWYVESVLARARAIAQLPSGLVDSLAGLARGRFPVGGEATYAQDRGEARKSVEIFSRAGARAIAVNDGRVVRAGYSARLGRYLQFRDVYGNRYTYGRLRRHAGLRERPDRGDRVDAGTTLGRLARRSEAPRPHLLFRIRPAGAGAPRIDPKPVLDGWRALESTTLRDAGGRALRGGGGRLAGIGRIALLSAGELTRRVLADARIEIYGCGRDDIRAGRIDRRVLATLEHLAASGLAPTVSSLRCGHGFYTASGNVSEHSTGSAVDISAINGIPVAGHQGPGSVTERTIQSLLALEGSMKPHQIISLMTFAGADNTFAMGDHADHIHVGFHPAEGPGGVPASAALLKPHQWTRLIDRIDALGRPDVPRAAPE